MADEISYVTFDNAKLSIMLAAMKAYGGSFAACLADAWGRADRGNSLRLEMAFPDLVERYGPRSAFYASIEKERANAGS